MIFQAGHFLQNGKYQIKKQIGGGGFGLTYLAEDTLLKRQVVIKIPNQQSRTNPDYEKFVRRWRREVNALAKINHPNVVQVFEYFQEVVGDDLNLILLDSTDALPSEGNNLIVVAKIDNFYHARIFDINGSIVLDKGSNEFSPDVVLAQEIDTALNKGAIDKQAKSDLTKKITSSLGYIQVKIPCLAMAYVEGETLNEHIRNKGKLSQDVAVGFCRKLASALDILHKHGVIHCDVNPINIILRSNDEPVLIDFGSAKLLQPGTFTVTTSINESFAPYEQSNKENAPQPTLDVYGLAATLYFAVTGQKPQASISRKMFGDKLQRPKQISGGIENWLDKAILKGMALEATDRPVSMQAWLKLLENDASTSDEQLLLRRRLLSTVKQEISSRLRYVGAVINLHKEFLAEQTTTEWSTEFNQLDILEIFEHPRVLGRLLILGASGAGKTTTLLDLSQKLISRAEYESDFPVPIFFNLRSWTENDSSLMQRLLRRRTQPIDKWLIDELTKQYGVKSEIASQWLEDKYLLPVLDGLDEVGDKQKIESCIQAINDFLSSDFSPSYIIISCRTSLYSSSSIKLRLNGALQLQPVTPEQVENYFLSANYPELRQAFRSDQSFSSVLSTPLLLAITKDVFKKASIQGLDNINSIEILEKLESSKKRYIEAVINRARLFPDGKIFYSINLTGPVQPTLIGESIEVKVELTFGVNAEAESYLLELSNEDSFNNDVTLLLEAPGFQVNDSNVNSFLLELELFFKQKSVQTYAFRLTCLKAGVNNIAIKLYCGDFYETTLETSVRVTSPSQNTLLPKRIPYSRPVPQPDLILKVQTCWNENLSNCTFCYQLNSFHSSLLFANEVQQYSNIFAAEWLEQIKDLLQITLESSTNSLSKDTHSRLLSLGQYLFQQLLPLEIQSIFRSVMHLNRSFTLLIVNDQDAELPWELIHDGQYFLGERFIVGHWLWELEKTLPYEFAIGSIRVSYYANVRQPEQWLSVLQLPDGPISSLLPGGVLEDLRSVESIRGLHILRQGEFDNKEHHRNVPVPVDNNFPRDIEQELQPIKLNLRRYRPLVTLGHMSQDVKAPTTLAQTWAPTFIRSGCSAFVGSLWTVEPAIESAFISNFYYRLWSGASLGMAFQAGRQAARVVVPESLDWMAYKLYGDPMARPYRPARGKGYAIVEPVGQDISDPIAPGEFVRFRVSLRRAPPVWYTNRLMDVEEDLVFDDLKVYIMASGLRVTPNDSIDMKQAPTDDYFGWFTLTIPSDFEGNSALVRVHYEDGDEPIHSLRFSLSVGNQEVDNS